MPRCTSLLLALTIVLAIASPVGTAATEIDPFARTSGWYSVPVPKVGQYSHFYAVAAASATNAWAVGEQAEGALIERWDGAAWSVAASPADERYLLAVAALSSSDVWAVGKKEGGIYAYRTVTEHWDGAAWTVIPSPNPSKDPLYGVNVLQSVVALAPDDAWAAGWQTINGGAGLDVVAMHWNGTRWSLVGTPDIENPLFSSLAGLAADDVWAAGSSFAFASPHRTLAEHWDGTSWQIVPTPNIAGAENVLASVAAIASDDVWAVGQTSLDGSRARTLVEHWNGTSWVIVPSPNADPSWNSLTGVAAISANDVWAVGVRGQGTSQRTLIEHWDGASWSIVTSPNPQRDRGNAAVGVAPDLSGGAWSVGYTFTPDYQDRPIALRTNG
jgi:hypothetical protein